MAATLTSTIDSLDPEEMVVCPFDPVHRLRRKRLQYHIMKCSLNQDMQNWRKCPFNAIHFVQKYEFDYHLQVCPDRGRVEAELIQQAAAESSSKLKGYTDLPVSDWMPPEPEEDWNDDNVRFEPPEREGIFGSENIPSRAPQAEFEPPPVQVEDPPQLRKPRPVGRGSQVYQYSLASAETRMGGRTYLQTEQEPVGGQGRGRGRGRWFSGGVATTPPPPGGLLAGPQLLTPSLNSEPPRSEEDEAERFKKTKRKLEKMLRQIEELEQKQLAGIAMNEEQSAKLDRKEDVQAQLEKICLQ